MLKIPCGLHHLQDHLLGTCIDRCNELKADVLENLDLDQWRTIHLVPTVH